jgi:glycosyltransferase involved in cell wall biosynthesis|tara:strand:- start:59 stop:886 length:828 start_codon:yes stop_codon:yes gene_type:complete
LEFPSTKDITVIVCTYNSEKILEACLGSIRDNQINDIIVVDANSKDKTINIAKKYNVKLLHDPGIGLGKARNIGLENVITKYVIYVGPDNVMPEQSIIKILNYMLRNDWVGISCMTFIKPNSNSYLEQSLNFYKKAKFFPGEKNVIGTPWLYPTEILKKYKFNEKSTYSDDTELCYRLLADGYKVGISDTFCYEIGTTTLKNIKQRWIMYGKSDSEFYTIIKHKLTLKNRIKSRLHAINVDLLLPLNSKHISFLEKIKLLPFLFLITFFRLRGFN